MAGCGAMAGDLDPAKRKDYLVNSPKAEQGASFLIFCRFYNYVT